MARKTQRAELSLSVDQRSKLEQISKSRKAPLREVQRSQVLLHYADGISISQIQDLVKVSRPTVYKCIDNALAAGPDTGLKDYYHRPFDPSITNESKTWIVNLACTKPKDHGLAAELWTFNELAKFSRKHAPEDYKPYPAKVGFAIILVRTDVVDIGLSKPRSFRHK